MVKIKYVRPDLSEGSSNRNCLERYGISISQFREEIEPFVRDLAIDYSASNSLASPITNWYGHEKAFVLSEVPTNSHAILTFMNQEFSGESGRVPRLSLAIQDVDSFRRSKKNLVNKIRTRDLLRNDTSTAINNSYPIQYGYLLLRIPEHRNSPEGRVIVDPVRRVVPEGSRRRFRSGLFNLLD